MCDILLLSNKNATTISQCLHCQTLYLWHNNLLLSFTSAEFATFQEITNRFTFDEDAVPFPDYQMRLVMQLPEKQIGFAFMEEEWHDLQVVIREAMLMQEVYEAMR
ncbi:hypothetical protein HUW51_05605 [Adhaeribacter swui]|uniref:Uncharacterized protein n=1 Tax=Adhaeribacter swui TaxID=2086471 RepID=A0A7G7G4Z6_9BACT|nr:DUF6686 family protein [Adhaeribacter swui]QNF32230.1 hypothetical protein HUW51_05605 [Adhaeribacter swui]